MMGTRSVHWYKSLSPDKFMKGINTPYSGDYWLGMDHLVTAYKHQQKLRMHVEVVTNNWLKFFGEYSGFTLTMKGQYYVMDYESFNSHCKFNKVLKINGQRLFLKHQI